MMEREDFVQLYLFHINIIKLKTSQYILGASTLILSEVCQKSIYLSMKWESLNWQLIALCHLPFCFIANNTYCQNNVKAMAVMLDWAPKSQNNTSCVHIFVLVKMTTEENDPQTAYSEMQPCHWECKYNQAVNH